MAMGNHRHLLDYLNRGSNNSIMISRNFKVRIKNLNLKQTFWLVQGESIFEVLQRFQKIILPLGYHLSSHKNPTANSRTYIFYPDAVRRQQRKDAMKDKRNAIVRKSKRIFPRRRYPRIPEHEVHLEIVQLKDIPVSNYITERQAQRKIRKGA